MKVEYNLLFSLFLIIPEKFSSRTLEKGSAHKSCRGEGEGKRKMKEKKKGKREKGSFP